MVQSVFQLVLGCDGVNISLRIQSSKLFFDTVLSMMQMGAAKTVLKKSNVSSLAAGMLQQVLKYWHGVLGVKPALRRFLLPEKLQPQANTKTGTTSPLKLKLKF